VLSENLIHPIESPNFMQAWLACIEALLNEKTSTLFNLVVAIKDPVILTDADRAGCDAVDKFLRQRKSLPLITVANTIFPGGFYRDQGAEGVYEEFPKSYEITKEKWGTYAGRLFTKIQTKEGLASRIESVVRKLKKNTSDAGVRMKSSYEVDVLDTCTTEEISVYCAESDAHLGIGQPCLVHLSFKLHRDDTISLTAVYRAQYYVAKALGNFVGLAQLLAFVAAEAGLKPGFLVCHATMAELDLGNSRARWTKEEVRELVHECRSMTSFIPEPVGLPI
jgi:hypothetical protein